MTRQPTTVSRFSPWCYLLQVFHFMWCFSEARLWHFPLVFFSKALGPPPGPTQFPVYWLLGVLSLGSKRPGHEADHLSPSSAEVENEWSYTSTLPYAIMECIEQFYLSPLLYWKLAVTSIQQDRQCTYDVTLRRVRELLLRWETSKYYIIVCVRAPAFLFMGARAPVHACACIALLIQRVTRMRRNASSFMAFQVLLNSWTLSHKRHDFRKKVTEHKMCVLMFSTTFIKHISQCKKNLARCHKCENVFMLSTRHSCRIVIKLEFNSTDFKKKKCKRQISSKFVHWESSCSTRAGGWTDGHDEANSSFSQFCERAEKLLEPNVIESFIRFF